MAGVRRNLCAFILAALFTPLLAAAPASAQSWPTRPVKFILTLGPGSGADIGARLLADRLTKKWDQPVVIENRPGGDGIVAINTFVDRPGRSRPAVCAKLVLHRPSLPARQSAVQAERSRPDRAGVQHRGRHFGAGRPAGQDAQGRGRAGARQARPAQLGRPDRRPRHHVRRLAQEHRRSTSRRCPTAIRSRRSNDLAAGRVQVYEAAYAIVRPQVQAGKIKVLAVTNTARASAIPTSRRSRRPAIRR